jgi:membrane-bound metal-dependent hydrolase YbcI (DUF457 family)
VDIVTHALASFAVARGFFPRLAKPPMMTVVVLVGCVADVDWLTQYIGPSAFLDWHRMYTHSILGTLLISAILPAIFMATIYWGGIIFWGGMFVPLGILQKGEAIPDDPSAMRKLVLRTLLVAGFAAPLCAGLFHIAMDACQSNGVALLWPFSPKRFAADWLPGIDPWILTILVAAIALPELLHLVGSEIGAKAKKPRGQTGAVVGLALVLLYVGVRATLHSNALATMESRTFHGETSRRASAFPESLSLLSWHGIVETDSALNEIDVNAASSSTFDPDASLRIFKPEPSPALAAARNTRAARRFLSTALIPKASLEKTEAGYVVVLRDLRYAATGETQHEVAALIELDLNNKVTSQELMWARDLRK